MPVIQFIPQTYCPTCHLSTRMDISRCLHCNQPLRPAVIKSVKKRPVKQVSTRSDRFAAKLGVAARRRQSRHTVTGKAKSRQR